jgi:Ca2+-binding RTX toxin-like protein
MPAPSKWGSEAAVSTVASTSEATPKLTTLADGRYAVAWIDNALSTNPISFDTTSIRYQILQTEGFHLAAETVLDSRETNAQDFFADLDFVGLDNGKIGVTYVSTSAGTEIRNTIVTVLNANGSGYSTSILANFHFNPDGSTTGFTFPVDLAAAPGGGLIVTRTFGNTTSRIFDTSGAALQTGAEFVVSGGNVHQTAAADSSGNIAFAWTDATSAFDGVGGGAGIVGKLFLSPVPTGPAGPAMGFNGTTAGNQDQPDLVFASPLAPVVVYRDDSTAAANGTNIRMRYGSGSEVVVNTTLAGNQEDPKIALLANGKVVVVWTDRSSGNADIRARILDPVTGASDHNDFLVNTITAGQQTDAKVTALPDGRFVVAWNDAGFIHTQTFDPRTGPYSFAGTSADEQRSGTVFNDSMAGGDGNDRLYGFSGNDILYGGAGNDTLIGSGGDDVHDGGTGVDTLIGSLGNDAYYLNDVGANGRVVDTIIEAANSGIDGVRTSVNVNLNEARYANVENGYLTGTAVTNLGGSAVNNVLIGNDAANAIYGLGGRDIMRGGLGADKFVYLFNSDTGKTAATRDLIQDFTHLTDKIDLSALDANGAGAGNGTFVFQSVKGAAFTGVAGQLHYLASGANTLIEGDLNGDAVADFQIELTGTIATLTGGVDIIL